MPEEKKPRGDMRFMVSLPPDVAERLKARAGRELTPVSVLLRRWIVEKLGSSDDTRSH